MQVLIWKRGNFLLSVIASIIPCKWYNIVYHYWPHRTWLRIYTSVSRFMFRIIINNLSTQFRDLTAVIRMLLLLPNRKFALVWNFSYMCLYHRGCFKALCIIVKASPASADLMPRVVDNWRLIWRLYRTIIRLFRTPICQLGNRNILWQFSIFFFLSLYFPTFEYYKIYYTMIV